MGLLLPDVPEEYGGGGGTFAHEAVVIEELARAGVHFGVGAQSVVAHHVLAYGSEAQKRRWLPRLASGELIGAIGMTEPDSGTDLQAIRTLARKEGDHYVIDGSKTFITNGRQASLICLAGANPPRDRWSKGLSLIMIETAELTGYRVGRSLAKIGPACAGHVRAVLRRRARAGVEPARSRRRPGVVPIDGSTAL